MEKQRRDYSQSAKMDAFESMDTMAQQHRVGSARNLLMLAYVFPPFFSIGGSIRVVKFIKYLCPLGWRPVVLTIGNKKEYEMMSNP